VLLWVAAKLLLIPGRDRTTLSVSFRTRYKQPQCCPVLRQDNTTMLLDEQLAILSNHLFARRW
jgi:hypothetical protein